MTQIYLLNRFKEKKHYRYSVSVFKEGFPAVSRYITFSDYSGIFEYMNTELKIYSNIKYEILGFNKKEKEAMEGGLEKLLKEKKNGKNKKRN